MENLVVSIIGQLNLKNMKLTPIKYQEGWLYVDKEADVKSGDLFELDYANYPKMGIYLLENEEDASYIYEGKRWINHIWNLSNNYNSKELVEANWNKIVAQRNLSLPNIPYIEEVDEAKQFISDEWAKEDEDSKFWIKVGYKAAQSKGGYSEDDLREAFKAGQNYENEQNYDDAPDEDEYIQSLNQPKENIEIITKCSMCSMIDGHKMGCNTESLRNQTPVTYRKDRKTFLKVKQ
jgi:hypothetical protein